MFSKIKLRVGVILFILFSLHIISFAQAQQQNGASPQNISSLAIGNTPKYSPDRIIVKFKNHVTSNDIAFGRLSKIEERNAKFGVYEVKQLFKKGRENDKLDKLKESLGLTRIYVLKVSKGTDIEQMVNEYSQDPDVEYAEPDYIVEASYMPNDKYFNTYQWNLHNTGQTAGTVDADIDAPEAWDITTGSSSVIIAIVDTGVQLTHSDLSVKILSGYDFVNSDNDPSDDNGHGTHVAGIAAASSNNSTGVAGVCWNCLIMPVKVLDNTGSGYVSNVASGITYATDNGAKVINLSLVSSGYSTTLYNAVLYAYNAGRVIVAGTGNDGIETVYYPAGHKEVIAVGATNSYDVRTSWSNYGAKIDVVAPGENIISSYPHSAYAWASGTSMATPHVAGLAGLILSHNPTYNTDQVRWHIELAADDQVGNSSEDITGWDKYHGWGRINACNSLQPISSGLTFSTESAYADSYSKGVNPSSGTTSTTFTYKVIYIDDYNWSPYYVQVCIDDYCYNMNQDTSASSTLRDGDYANGEQYVYVTNLLAGSHNCYFIASNGIDTKILPKVGTLSGPTVIDNTPPTGSITINSGAAYINSLYVTLTLSCIDTGSGCAQTQFSNDNTNWSTPEAYTTTKAWTLTSGDGTKTAYVKFKDNAGNWSGAYSDTIILDTIAPTTTASPPGGTYASAQSVTLTCNDGTGSGCDKIYYTTDGSTPTTTSPVYSVPINISTTTTLKFFATDLTGNQETVKTEIYTITIDTTPPTGSITINSGAIYTNTTSVTLTLTCDDGGGTGCSQMQFSNDNTTYSTPEPYATTKAWTLTSGDSTKTVYAKFKDNAGNWSGAYNDTIVLAIGVNLLSPNGGEVIPSGSTYTIQWLASPEAVKFDLMYSLNNGTTLVTIANNVTGNSYNWKVPKPLANKKRCFVKVIGYNASGIKVGEDTSDSTFTIEVVRLTSPNGGETLRSGNIHTITWTTNATKRPVAGVKLFYTINGGTTWAPIKTLTGNPGSYNWRVPNVSSSSCKVKVVLKDASGNKVGSDVSDNYFTIQP